MFGIYVHVPFCIRKCRYCDFNSYPGLENYFERYAAAVADEAKSYGQTIDRTVDTVYFGGGTPTLADPRTLAGILDGVAAHFDLARDAEITIEANPETVDRAKLAELSGAGFNRISIGFQSLDQQVLEFLGRGHSAEDAVKAFSAARRAGFDSISVDLIFGIPEQSMASWAGTLIQSVALGPDHISTYSLTLEEGTALAGLVDAGTVQPPDEDAAADMFEFALDLLPDEGYEHYEISNFAKPRKHCKHNLIYWDMGDYIGIGAGAHSKLAAERWANVAGVREYLEATDKIETKRLLDDSELLSENLFLGLRKIDGVELRELKEAFGEETVAALAPSLTKLTEAGLLKIVGDRLSLTFRVRRLGK
ncbi:MAG: radical SAM family heme chaperone HemW [Chloroflexi bacterium]|nr:radical SAM family heme chaperone HemW [Chloroflexota bacterium]